MNWMEIISAHVMWIYGEDKPMKMLPGFEEVRELHAKFHQNATQVVVLHQPDNTAEAKTLLNGDYSRLSEKLKHRILGLSHQVKSATNGGSPF